MKRFLIVIDMQKDFVSGALGTAEAQAILPYAKEKIRAWEGEIFVTLDTHFENYLDTAEGKSLPVPHCIKGSEGWRLDGEISAALSEKRYTTVEKPTFGAVNLPDLLVKAAAGEDFSMTLIGLCTDICVISNALLLKAHFPEKSITVDAAACAGVTPETHDAALKTMKMCQIKLENEKSGKV